MKKLVSILSLCLVSTSVMAAGVEISQPVVVQGCGGGVSATISPDKQTLSVLFDNFSVEGKYLQRKNCKIKIPMQVPAGTSITLQRFDFRGYIDLPQNNVAKLTVAYNFDYQKVYQITHNWQGAYSNDIFASDNLEQQIGSACGKPVNFFVNSTIETDSHITSNETNFFTIDSLDTTLSNDRRMDFKIGYQNCYESLPDDPDFSTQWGQLKSGHGHCLGSADATANSGVGITAQACVSAAHQYFILSGAKDGENMTGVKGQYTFIQGNKNKCWNPENNGTANGTRIILGKCKSGNNGFFNAIPVEGTHAFRLVNLKANKCATLVNGILVLDSCRKEPTQIFTSVNRYGQVPVGAQFYPPCPVDHIFEDATMSCKRIQSATVNAKFKNEGISVNSKDMDGWELVISVAGELTTSDNVSHVEMKVDGKLVTKKYITSGTKFAATYDIGLDNYLAVRIVEAILVSKDNQILDVRVHYVNNDPQS